jgi:2-dehydro-3-deoxyphosphogluconate aldolase/(4S)-4-hydroxy-2-oxoglutarate aldolase
VDIVTYDELEARVRAVAVVPILQPRSVDFCLAASEALIAGGATGIEILCRAADALPAIGAVKRRFPDLLIAAGTILEPDQYRGAVDAGADFCISPGYDPMIVDLANAGPIRIVPGVQTASEVIAARRLGVTVQKFYPSEPAGGTAVLADYGSVFPNVAFMPSGRIDLGNLTAYGRLRNVASVGGSWMYAEGGQPLATSEMTHRMRSSLDSFAAARG